MIRSLVLVLAAAALLAGGYELTLGETQRASAVPGKPVPMVTVMQKEVVVDLAGGGYARVTLGVEVPPKWEEGFAESGLVRDIITRDLTNIDPEQLLVRTRRDRLKLRLERDIRAQTHVAIGHVLLSDFTIH